VDGSQITKGNMNIATLFWVIMVIWLLFGLWSSWPAAGTNPVRPVGGLIILWVVIALLGWQVFGSAIHR
jgi:hypothetical protein